MEKGIMIVGNLLVDKIKMIKAYPKQGMLTTISSESMAVGGCVPNTSIDIAMIDKTVPLFAFGCVGDDFEGRFILSKMEAKGINVSGIKVLECVTSYTDVMTVQNTGERTFFYSAGANSAFSPNDIDVIDCDMFHIGYLLLLEEFDKGDTEYGTVLARLLHDVQKKGIKTSIDIVSESSDRFKKIVVPALAYCDYCIINEVEAGEIVGELATIGNIEKIAKKIFSYGIKEKVIIHCPEAGFCLDKTGVFTIVPSLCLPQGFIKGAVGAGDAFCASCLYAIYRGYDDRHMLEFASLGAACNLSAADSVSGMRERAEIEKLEKLYARRKT